jgi:hypothetical protein
MRDQPCSSSDYGGPAGSFNSGVPNLDLMPLMTIDILQYHTDPTDGYRPNPPPSPGPIGCRRIPGAGLRLTACTGTGLSPG